MSGPPDFPPGAFVWGIPGDHIREGPTGPTGPQGEPGEVAHQGNTGPTGPLGATGPSGPTGALGATGPSGPSGPAGAGGASGATGPSGPSGPAGPSGASGPPGATGPVGPTEGYLSESAIQNLVAREVAAGAILGPDVVRSGKFSLGEVAGNIVPDLSKGRVFPVTSSAAVQVLAPINPPEGAANVRLWVEVPIVGNQTITTPGVTRWEGGPEPPWNYASSESINTVVMYSDDGGETWIGIAPPAIPAAPHIIVPVVEHAFARTNPSETTLPGLTIYVGAGQAKELVAVDLRLEEGTSLEAELQKNGVKVVKTKVEKGTPVRVAEGVSLADGDFLTLILSAFVGSPKKLSYTFAVKQTA